MKNMLWIALAVLVGSALFIGYGKIGEEGALMEGKSPENETMAAEKADSMMAGSYKGSVLAGSSSLLLDFARADYDKALSEGKIVVLYFYADWCPICKAEFPVMQEAFDDLDRGDIIGFRVNFKDNDTDADEVALARQWGVAYQHTKVFVVGGKQALKSPESWDRARYDSELSKSF